MHAGEQKTIIEFLKALSWQKILQVIIFIVIVIGSWTFWENRSVIYNSWKIGARVEVDRPPIIEISQSTKSYMDSAIARSNDLIVGIQITSVNFKRNIRSSAYMTSSDKELKDGYEKYNQTRVTDVPLFTDNEISNQRIIHLINGDFVCYNYRDTPASRLYVLSPRNITTVCSISIPPYYGRFIGYMNLYLTRNPASEDMTVVRQFARDLSLRVFESDVDKTGSGYKSE